MESINKRGLRDVFVYSILFLFFFQLITDFIAGIYAFGLMGTELPPEIAALLPLVDVRKTDPDEPLPTGDAVAEIAPLRRAGADTALRAGLPERRLGRPGRQRDSQHDLPERRRRCDLRLRPGRDYSREPTGHVALGGGDSARALLPGIGVRDAQAGDSRCARGLQERSGPGGVLAGEADVPAAGQVGSGKIGWFPGIEDLAGGCPRIGRDP